MKVVERIFENRIQQQINIDDMQFGLLGHLLRDDLINPVKMSVCPYAKLLVY